MVECWNPADYQEKGSFVPALGEPLLELLKIKPGQKVLDVGCGDGVLSLKILERGAALVGIDASPDMVAAAKRKGLDARLLDAHDLAFDKEFDAAFSNAALHWMTADPLRVVRNIHKALRPGGLFVAEMGGEGNIAGIIRCERLCLAQFGLDLDNVSPKFFPSMQVYAGLLKKAGFEVLEMELFDRPTALPDGLTGWLEVFSKKVLNAIPAEAVETFLKDMEACARPALFSPESGWQADYVRLRFVAKKPARFVQG